MLPAVPCCDHAYQFFSYKCAIYGQHGKIVLIMDAFIKCLYAFLRIVRSFIFQKYIPNKA